MIRHQMYEIEQLHDIHMMEQRQHFQVRVHIQHHGIQAIRHQHLHM